MSVSNSTPAPAVAYLRKSTKGKRKDRQKQEKSLAQQKAEILKLARGRFAVGKWFEDEGISGWKRGAGRPDYTRMLAEAQALGARAVLCDHIDRFSRATYNDVLEDTNALVRAGVLEIVTPSEGSYALGSNEIGDIIKFAAAAWSASQYSRNLSRRVSLARRNAAEKGKRTGGRVAYGLRDDGQGGYQWGEPAKAEVVRWLFEQFTNEVRSLSWLTGDLNRRGVPGPAGGPWYVKNVANLLRRPCYRGDFAYGLVPQGQFHRLDAEGEVVPREAAKGGGKVYRKAGAYTLVDPVLFDRAQARLAVLANNRGRRRRTDYPLTGVLVCDHCGGPMHGNRPHGAERLYRCGGTLKTGKGTCGRFQVREAAVLPLVMKLLAEEIDNVLTLLSKPPDEVSNPHLKATAKADAAKAQRVGLALKIERAVLARIESDDKRTRQDYDKLISKWRDELDRLEAEAAPDPAPAEGLDRDYIANLCAWFRGDNAAAVPVPFDGPLPLAVGLFRRARDEDGKLAKPQAVLADPRKVNDALHRLGLEVRLRWETTKAGGRTRHVLARGRFRLGQKCGDLATDGGVLGSSARRRPARPSRP
jgi:site-specific DNA recombinase